MMRWAGFCILSFSFGENGEGERRDSPLIVILIIKRIPVGDK